jgi:hypothetical protein
MLLTGTASGYLDLLDRLNTALTATGSSFAVLPSGSNVGNGRVTAHSGGSASVSEVIHITFSDATHADVSGVVSGALGVATVGTPFTSTKVNFTLVAGTTPWAFEDEFTLCTAPPWVALTTPVAASSTRWRLNILKPGGGPTEGNTIGRLEMSLTRGGADECYGSGGTATASSTDSTNYPANAFDTNTSSWWGATQNPSWIEYQFTTAKAIKQIAITAGTPFSWTNCPGWFTVEYWDGSVWKVAGTWAGEKGTGAGQRRVYPLQPHIWKAPGNDGLQEIIVGVHPFENAGAGWYNWRLQGFTGHSGGSVGFFDHPGSIVSEPNSRGPALALWDQAMDYWILVNGRRVVLIAKVGAGYEAMYLGLIEPFADPSPSSWPLPLAVGGSIAFNVEPSSSDVAWRYSNTAWQHSDFPCSRGSCGAGEGPGAGVSESAKLRIRMPDGTWLGFFGYNDNEYALGSFFANGLWPYAFGYRNLKKNLDGTAPVFSIMASRIVDPVNILGILDGVLATINDGVSAESEITIGYDKYLAFLDVTRAGAMDIFCLKED